MLKTLKNTYLLPRVYYALIAIICLFVLSFFIPALQWVPFVVLIGFTALISWDAYKLFAIKHGLEVKRELPLKFSNSDATCIVLKLQSRYNFKTQLRVIDEIPVEFQKRDFKIHLTLEKNQNKKTSYLLRPTRRGIYNFGKVRVFVSSSLQLIQRRYSLLEPVDISCYPSFIQMKKYSSLLVNKHMRKPGNNVIRSLGNSLEFEQIRPYDTNDDLRWVNWKATAKTQSLMVNQYQDSTTQNVYCILDKSRAMQMSFQGLSLLDYGINSTLALSNIVLKQKDNIGFLSISQTVQDVVACQNKTGQLSKINERLYNLTTNFQQSDFGALYQYAKTKITRKSLLILFTNFESMSSLNTQLPYLRNIAKKHALVVVFFENTLLEDIAGSKPKNIDEIVDKILAEKFTFEKRLIQQELIRYGIFTILTKPQNLSIDVIQKYIQLKAKAIL